MDRLSHLLTWVLAVLLVIVTTPSLGQYMPPGQDKGPIPYPPVAPHYQNKGEQAHIGGGATKSYSAVDNSTPQHATTKLFKARRAGKLLPKHENP
ncbi:hypothetical protein Sjap_008625 [Stephania japonica]|uniref:Secreted protein n=1 Tax=Stephania japonica TaxID=461633 RepID=A0AAP0JQK6_9MAGN